MTLPIHLTPQLPPHEWREGVWRTSLGLIPKLAVALSLIGIFFSLTFQFTTISDQKGEISRLQKEYREIRLAMEAAQPDPLVASVQNQALHDLNVLQNTLPFFHDFPHVLAHLNELMEKSALVASSGMLFTPERVGQRALWRYRGKLTVTGAYSKLKQFLSDLQALPGIHTLSTLQFKLNGELKEQIDLTMEISIYCRGDEI